MPTECPILHPETDAPQGIPRPGLDLAAEADGSWRVDSPSFSLVARVTAPDAGSPTSGELCFAGASEEPAEIGGKCGRVVSDRAQAGGLSLERRLFSAADRSLVGIQLAVRNDGPTPVALDNLTPLRVSGPDGLSVAGGGLPDWRFVRLGRHKSDIPGDFSFSIENSNLRDAAMDASKLVAGMGAELDGIENAFRTDCITAEPSFFIKNMREEAAPGIQFGIIGQERHLTTFTIRPLPDKSALEELRCDCEFDGVRLDPGEERVTHWMVIRAVEDESRAFQDLTALFAGEHSLPRPSRPPLAVYCTWQLYAFEFFPKDLDELLAALARRPMPIDVIQLDNGWIDAEGDWEPNHRFPGGMRAIADKIRAAGYIPGIWTCPLVLLENSEMFRQHPELAARRKDGSLCEYKYVAGKAYAVDPTSPIFRPYILALYRKLKDWGFLYHKLDFLRSIIVDEDIRFSDPKVNRAQAYRIANGVLREAMGEAYFASCGGIFDGGNAAFPDSVRTSADTYGFWQNNDSEKDALTRLKENVIRSYLNRCVRTDPDAACLRRRTEIFRKQRLDRHNILNYGRFTNDEAFTIAASHYWAGGNVTFCERMAELDEDRRLLYRHIIPSAALPARILRWHWDKAPNFFFTDVTPRAPGLPGWWTLGVCNWRDEPVMQEVDLSLCPLPGAVARVAVFEFTGQTYEGVHARDARLRLCIPPHATRLLRLAAWTGSEPVLLGTDLHLSGGAVEISRIAFSADRIDGEIDTKWEHPVTITALFPFEDRQKVQRAWVAPGGRQFSIVNA